MTPLQHYSMRVLRRWPVIVVLALVGAAASAAWFVATATTSYTATSALSTQSAERGPEQDAVLALGYVDYFNQESYQQLMRREASISEDVTLSAMTGATSPILYISATGSDEQDARTAAIVATETFRNDVRDSLIAERRRAADDIQTEIDRNTAELLGPPVLQDAQVSIVLDQIRSLQGRLTDTVADNTNHLKELQSAPGMSSSSPSPVVDVATGTVGGAVLGVLIALLLAVTDTHVRHRTDVRPRLGVDALAELGVRLAPAERARRVRNLGNALRLGGTVRRTVVAVVAPRHSAAAARLARELAAAGAARRARAVLVRADLTAPGDLPGFLDALSGRTSAQSAITAEPGGLRVLPAGRVSAPGADGRLVAPDQVTEILEEIAGAAALVVLEAPPLLEAPESQIICAAADRVLLVLERGATRWTDAREAVRLLAEVDATPAGVVLDEPIEDADGAQDEVVDASTDAVEEPATEPDRFAADQPGVVPAANDDNGSTLPVPSPGPRIVAASPDVEGTPPRPSPAPRAAGVPVGAVSDNHQSSSVGSPGHE